jgi:hypothetical protein
MTTVYHFPSYLYQYIDNYKMEATGHNMALQLVLLPSWRCFCGCGSATVGYTKGGTVYYLNHILDFTSVRQAVLVCLVGLGIAG